MKTRRGLALFVLVGMAMAFSSCAKDIDTSFDGSPTQPEVGTGADHTKHTLPAECTPTPSPSPSPSSSASPSITPSPTPSPDPTNDPDDPSDDDDSGSQPNPASELTVTTVPHPNSCGPGTQPQGPVISNTHYCALDNHGNIVTPDIIDVQDGNRIHVVAGGCVARPIREVWAVIANYGYWKFDDGGDVSEVAHPELAEPAKAIYRVFDIETTVHALGGLINPSWVTRWYHSVPYGTPQAPEQVVINYAKIHGTDHIRYLHGGYVLDRVAPNMTSFVMSQTIDADHTDAGDERGAGLEDLQRARTGAPAYDQIPK